MDTQDMILAELRELRSDYNSHARETGARLSTLESQMYSLCGNGQPGRIALLERALQRLQQWRWWLLGASAAVSGIATALAWIFVQVRK